MRRLLIVAIGLLGAALIVHDGALATVLVAAALVAAGVAWFESGPDSTRELAVVATLGAAAAAGRVLFAAVPGVQPVTVIAVTAGAALGLRAGVAVGTFAIAGALVLIVVGFGAGTALSASCDLNTLRPVEIGANSFVYAYDGSLLGSIPAERNREPQ